jgi:hypothetical protein
MIVGTSALIAILRLRVRSRTAPSAQDEVPAAGCQWKDAS